MYPLAKPKLKFELFLVDNSKSGSFHKNQNNRVICFADSYEVSNDGSVTFYQTAKTDDKRLRVPVLTYPNGKWEAVSLLDDNNYYPVFNSSGAQLHNNVQSPPIYKQDKSETVHELEEHEQHNHSQSVHGSNTGMPNVNMNMPGISNNPQEYKKAKNEWVEKILKEYVKSVDIFKTSEFISFIQKDSSFRQFRPGETDIEWSAATLIKERQVVARKFFEPLIQKKIGLILPGLMKRQWAGKMAPILESLTDREEAKNATAIDLAVWMAQNGIS